MFKISVIVTVFDVEKYIREALDSVIRQSIGFREHIQLIIVNDGSADHSADICREYLSRYPENVCYRELDNLGVSEARNCGLELAEGEYIAFLDGDDRWNEDAFAHLYRFLEENKETVDVAAARIYKFEADEGYHPLDYKFKGEREATRVAYIDRPDEYDSVQSTAVTAMYRKEAIADLRFDPKLHYGEDSVFINRLILEKQAYGLVAEAEYGYRRRSDSTSAVNNQRQDSAYFLDTLEYYHKALLNCSRDKFGKVIPYIQNVVYYDLAFRFSGNPDRYLASGEKEIFFARAREILQDIEDFVIFDSKRHKLFAVKETAYRLKKGHDLLEDITADPDDKKLRIKNDTIVYDFTSLSQILCRLTIFEQKDGNFHIEGIVSKLLMGVKEAKPRLVFMVDKARFPAVIKGENRYYSADTIYGRVYYADNFAVDIPAEALLPAEDAPTDEPPSIQCKIRLYGKKRVISMGYGKFIPAYKRSPGIFQKIDDYFVFFRTRRIQVIRAAEGMARQKYKELDALHLQWLRENEHEDVEKWIKKYYWHCRMRYFRPKKQVWLLSDRLMNAGDNGEVLFKYLNRIKPEGIRPVFVISKDAACVPRLKEEGEVVFVEDEKYKMLFLDAKKIISSGASEQTLNPFGSDRNHLTERFQYKFYYLQHGVACADLSNWLGKYKKNIHRIYTSSEKEREAFIKGGYGYEKKNIVLAGQARFDELYDAREKRILIMPTWRKSIRGSYDSNTTSIYYPGFKETEYYQFYEQLINHPALLDKMREKGYTGSFCLHPIHQEQWVDFCGNDVFEINEGYVDYNAEFARASLAVTDYSSVIFDFAYLHKPVIYAQFDRKQFFMEQTYDEGYFCYEEDGFGPVCHTLEETVGMLIDRIEEDCRLQEQYAERINAFFAFDDKKNCERIYENIRKG